MRLARGNAALQTGGAALAVFGVGKGPSVLGEAAAAEAAAQGGTKITGEGLDKVANHLAQFGDCDYNTAMMNRLRSALENGDTLSGADANFYLHESTEADLMNQGLDYDAAHAASLVQHDASPFSLYHPEVIQNYPDQFSPGYFQYWEITR